MIKTNEARRLKSSLTAEPFASSQAIKLHHGALAVLGKGSGKAPRAAMAKKQQLVGTQCKTNQLAATRLELDECTGELEERQKLRCRLEKLAMGREKGRNM